MNKNTLRISSIFSDKKNKPLTIGKMSIKTLFKNNNEDDNNNSNNNNNNNNIDSRELLVGIYEKRNKLNKYYNKIFKKCWETIRSANKSGFMNITYEIPKFSELIGYNCSDCINFVKIKLEEQKLDVNLMSNIKIYISWEKLECKIKDKNTKSSS